MHDTGRGPIIVQYRRRVSGIDVYAEPVAVLLRRNLQPVAVVGSLREPDAVPSANSQNFPLAKGRKVWVRQKNVLMPALVSYRTDAQKQSLEMFVEVRSWPDNQLLRSARITDEVANDYLVYTGDDPYGSWGPHPTGIPDLTRPTVAAPQQLLRIDELSTLRNDPWLPAGASRTQGNNTDAFFNTLTSTTGTCLGSDADDTGIPGVGDFRALLRGTAFNYVYDPARSHLDPFHTWSMSPCPAIDSTDSQLNAKVVQAFYTANLLHDFFYDAGFDETSGNSQQDNYGRGGASGDPVIVKVGSTATFINTLMDGDSAVLTIGQNGRSTSPSRQHAGSFGVCTRVGPSHGPAPGRRWPARPFDESSAVIERRLGGLHWRIDERGGQPFLRCGAWFHEQLCRRQLFECRLSTRAGHRRRDRRIGCLFLRHSSLALRPVQPPERFGTLGTTYRYLPGSPTSTGNNVPA